MATEGFLRSRLIFKTTSTGNTHEDDPMEVDALSRKGKAKENPAKGKKGGKKGKDSRTGKGYEETTAEHSRFDGECRNCGKHGHKAADCWYKQQKPQDKCKSKTKSKVTEISESDKDTNLHLEGNKKRRHTLRAGKTKVGLRSAIRLKNTN